MDQILRFFSFRIGVLYYGLSDCARIISSGGGGFVDPDTSNDDYSSALSDKLLWEALEIASLAKLFRNLFDAILKLTV